MTEVHPVESVRASFEELTVCGRKKGKKKSGVKKELEKATSGGKARVKVVTGKQLTEKLEKQLRGHKEAFSFAPPGAGGLIESEFRHTAEDFKSLQLVLQAHTERRAQDDSGTLPNLCKLLNCKPPAARVRSKSFP